MQLGVLAGHPKPTAEQQRSRPPPLPNLQGLVRLDAFVERTTGELEVVEVDTTPALTPDSPLFQQVRVCVCECVCVCVHARAHEMSEWLSGAVPAVTPGCRVTLIICVQCVWGGAGT